jgi:hypothetical protein
MNKMNTLSLTIGTALLATLAAADACAFGAQTLAQGYQVVGSEKMASAGCGGSSKMSSDKKDDKMAATDDKAKSDDKATEASCGGDKHADGSCGGDKAAGTDAKADGDEKAKTEGSCGGEKGEGSCGGAATGDEKKTEGSCGGHEK